MEMKHEVYLGDGLYMKYDGFSVWLRAPRADSSETGGLIVDHVVALEPQVMKEFIRQALQIPRHAQAITTAVNEWRRQRVIEPQGYDTLAERDIDRPDLIERLTDD